MDKQPRAPRLSDPEFEQTLTLADAYRVLVRFVEQYNTRGESSTLDLLGDLSLDVWSGGGSSDPAQLEDFLAVAELVLGRRGHGA